MDRADKLYIYRKKRKRARGRRVGPSHRTGNTIGTSGTSYRAIGLVILAAGLLAVLFFLVHKKNSDPVLAYVTHEEFASMMSFLGEDPAILPEQERSDPFVTQGDLKDTIQSIGLAGMISVAGGTRALEREKVMEYYDQILDYLDLGEAVSKKALLILEQTEESCLAKDGEYSLHAGIPALEALHVYDVYLLEEMVLGVCGESGKAVTLPEVYITKAAEGEITFTYDGREYRAAYADAEQSLTGVQCTLSMKNGKVAKIKDVKGQEDAGKRGDNVKDPAGKSTKISEKMPDTVRVLLLNKGDIHYSQVYLSCSGTCKAKGTKQKKYKASDTIDIKKLKIKKGKSVTVTPEKGSAQIFLTDKKGRPVSKGYYGSMTVYRDREGYYVVNKVEIEKYLYSVVASEMPSSFDIEALKAQAVCARSYVYRHMENEDYSRYHAQIDDSTNYQVYNRSDVSTKDIKAVKDTAGTVMYAGDEIVNAYYFSASCGYGSGMEIWDQEGVYPYLSAKALMPGTTKVFDLSEEKNFRAYITDKDIKAYDSNSRYFRWTAKVEPSICLKELKEKIVLRNAVNPKNFTFYSTAKGKDKEVDSMKGFGGFEKMYCAKRSKSGAVLDLDLVFEYGKVQIRSEYNIRSVLGCAMEQITYADSSVDTAVRFLPSAYFSLSFDKESKRYLLSGGGNGHGVGMSQYGADSMAKSGWDHKKILKFFYDDIKLEKINKYTREQ